MTLPEIRSVNLPHPILLGAVLLRAALLRAILPRAGSLPAALPRAGSLPAALPRAVLPRSALLRAAALGAALLLVTLPAAGPAAATGTSPGPCTAAAPCRAGGGDYLALLPDGPVRGAVIFLHGHNATAQGIIGNAALAGGLLARGWALVAPQGARLRPEAPGGGWTARDRPGARDDRAFLLAVAEDAARRLALPRARIALAGFSGGAMMVWRMACERPDAFLAFAPVAGTLWRPRPEACAGPVRLLHVQGWSDPVVPIEGRRIPGTALEQGDLFAALALLRRAAACPTDAPSGFGVRGAFLLRDWTACAPGAAIALALHPGGHAVPADWPALMLDWLEALPAAGGRPPASRDLAQP